MANLRGQFYLRDGRWCLHGTAELTQKRDSYVLNTKQGLKVVQIAEIQMKHEEGKKLHDELNRWRTVAYEFYD